MQICATRSTYVILFSMVFRYFNLNGSKSSHVHSSKSKFQTTNARQIAVLYVTILKIIAKLCALGLQSLTCRPCLTNSHTLICYSFHQHVVFNNQKSLSSYFIFYLNYYNNCHTWNVS